MEDQWGFGFPTQAGGLVELNIANVGKVTRFDAQEISHIMDEEGINDSFPCLKELESKIGRKMPESLLVWMRDECEDVGSSGEGSELSSGLGDSFSEKISTLKQEMVNVPSGFQLPHKRGLCSVVITCLAASFRKWNNLHNSFSPSHLCLF